ncbi:MAG TPA: S-layer homology domain-containing protein [Abditibacteriaceae bacterium]|nr:S-layer homology domain-containing protein [Abditibacteriaceae bacterium]
MKHKATLGVMIAFAAAAPAVVVPQLVTQAQAQDAVPAVPAEAAPAADQRADYPDVLPGHWAYDAIDKLSRAGVVEGLPDGNYHGPKPMTRYEFAVAIARLMDRFGAVTTTVVPPAPAAVDLGPLTGRVTALEARPQVDIGPLTGRVTALEARPVPDITRAEVNDLLTALKNEFRDELGRLGVRVGEMEGRLSNLESRVAKPPRLTFTPSILWRGGTANYITQSSTPGIGGQFAPNPGPGRNLMGDFGNSRFGTLTPGVVPAPGQALPAKPAFFQQTSSGARVNSKYSYTDFELRMTDRISDRLSLNAALRSLGSTQEDPWAGEYIAGSLPSTGGGIYVSEANAVADLSDRHPLGIRNLAAIIGRQRTKNALGLLYDNDLASTDQAQVMFNFGPFSISGFNGTNNNQVFSGTNNPYGTTGAVRYLGLNSGGNGSQVGFPAQSGPLFPEDNESLARVGFNLFRIGGQPISLGVSRLFDGYQNQTGDSLDLSLSLFNRTVGFEWVRGRQYSSGQGTDSDDRPTAYYVTAPLLRTKFIDLNAAYGSAQDDFEYFVTSAANPFARTYSEAIFDRPMFLGSPMINGLGSAGEPLYMAAKRGYDFNGTVRIPIGFLKRFPIDFRYYKAKGSSLTPGGSRTDLGDVFYVGSGYSLSPGIDLEYKFGQYDVPGPAYTIRYVRVGVNVGF